MHNVSRTALHSRLVDIRRQIASLRVEEEQLEQAIRAMHMLYYPILSIPVELTIVILKVCVKDDPQHDPLALSHVCGQWRQIALATPELWTNIQSVMELPVWFNRSGTYPLHAHVTIRSSADLTTLNGYLVNYPLRWKTLVYAISNKTRFVFPSTNLPNLRELSLHGCPRPPVARLAKFAPALEEMHLGSSITFNTPSGHSKFVHLQALSLGGNPHTCYDVLCLVPQLQSLTIFPDAYDDLFSGLEYEPIFLPQLQVLVVQRSTTFIDCLNLPALGRLVLACHLHEESTQDVKSLISRSSCSIRALEFDGRRGGTWSTGLLEYFFQQADLLHVRELTLRDPPEGQLCYMLCDVDDVLPALEIVRIVDYQGLIDMTALALVEERMGDHGVEGVAKLKSWQFLFNSDEKKQAADLLINQGQVIDTLIELRSQGKLIIEARHNNRPFGDTDAWGLNDYLDTEVAVFLLLRLWNHSDQIQAHVKSNGRQRDQRQAGGFPVYELP
ncbi:hypothetical protein FB45DRAFT_859263 [Roridomyces roridus]|uniref:F-box domain-containing protein n=1 Tax=Roridomyces roridus TaxID=1738132 RepID=A0AAD7FYM9_9AGAR|nr:hypothetical protein FB45DRAFT_859263 [Roridomyces roridus]